MADRRLTDQDVEQKLVVLDGMLGQLEQIPGATAALGLDVVRALTEVYGEALARLWTMLAVVPAARDAAIADDFVGDLLILHNLHPQTASERITRALEGLGPALESAGSGARLTGIAEGVAEIELARGGCPSSASVLESAVRDAALAAAPELRDVRITRAAVPKPLPLIPVAEVRSRPRPRAAGQAAASPGDLR
jgi:Fe-S cluster biogenesis protein NfuA